ncbi:MAG: succinate dehydrogenase cytochrome b subunit [Desulfobacterales bacterium]|nr:succinate dehydrogenase cytochrome b subunit [Desulfobacterales bacterium]
MKKNWFVEILLSSIGKKLLMAITGFSFCLFLTAHLIGNLTLYGGKFFFLSYVTRLHSLGIIINIAEICLLFMAIVHIGMGCLLFYENTKARPIKYAIKVSGGGRTIGSSTMPYTGLFLFLFIIMHLFNFHFVDKGEKTIYKIVTDILSNPFYVAFYIFAMGVVAIHVSHGFWSVFQTLGLNHPKYMPLIKNIGIAFSIIIGIGFGFIPIYISLFA